MSTSDDAGLARKAKRIATPPYRGRRDVEMNTVGWAIFLILVALLVPLLPFLAIVWLLQRIFDRATPRSP